MKTLADLVPSWEGSLVDDAWAEVAEGLRRERERFAKARFLVVAFRREFDEDGLTEAFDAIEPATSEFEGDKIAGRLAAASGERFGDPSWPQTPCEEREVKALRKPTIDVARLRYRGFARKDPRGKNAVYCHFEVLQVWTKTTFGNELLSYLGCEPEMVDYLRHRARQPVVVAPPPPAVLAPCPRCGIELEQRAKLSACRGCGGVWLTREATRAVLTHVGALPIVVAAEKAARAATGAAAEPRTARCPWDAEPLARQTAEGVAIDVCRVHGAWFDAGEVRRIANANTESSPARAPKSADVVRRDGDDVDAFFGALDAVLDMLDD